MQLRARDLPGAVVCLALALSRGERREALLIAQLVRGLAIQVTYRFCTGELLATPGRATLLYTRLDRPRAHPLRSLIGVLAATGVGLTLFLLSNTLLLLPVSLLLRLDGADSETISTVALAVAGVRLTWTATRALRSYALERRRERFLPRLGDQPRWRLDLMGSTPAGAGHGAALLRELVTRADAAGATVYLLTEPHNRAFYRRGGFHPVTDVPDRSFTGMLLMRRVAPQARVPRQRINAAALTASR